MGAAGGRDRRFPFVGRADIGERQRGEPLRHFEDAREIFRALDVACQPVEIVGGTREHLRRLLRTMLALVPLLAVRSLPPRAGEGWGGW